MRRRRAIAAAVVVLACSTCAGVSRAGSDSCPATLTLWEASEQIVEARSWTFRYLDMHGDRARFRALEVWFDVPELDAADERWFVPESLRGYPWPSLLSVSSRTYAIAELAPLCVELEGRGLVEIREAALDMCGPGDGSGVLGGASVTAELRTSASRDGMRYGIVTQGGPDDERCAPTGSGAEKPGEIEGSIRVETRVTREIGELGSDSDDELAASVHSVIDVWGRFLADSPREDSATQGLAAMPGARRMLALLGTLDAGAAPQRLRSELALAIGAGAPRDYTVSLALEILELAEAREHLYPALLFLGDQPAPAALDDLIGLLRQPTDDQAIIGLALRALLKIDPVVARLQAIELLTDPSSVPLAALGAFALTESGLARELRALDLGDHDAVREAAVRTVNYLASSATDDDLRAAASGIQRGATFDQGVGSP